MNFLYPKPGSALKLTVSSRLSRHIHVSMAFYTTDASKMQLPPRPPRTQSLAGTVVDHTSYLFLHTRVPPESWPKTFSSPLFLQLKERLGKYGGLVNVSWSEPGPSVSSLIGLSESIEAYTGTFWTRTEGRDVCRGVHLPMVTTNNMSIFDENLGQLADGNSVLCSVDSRTTDIMPMGPYFYICCHGHRDCRCGFRGGDLADALTDELAKRNMLLDEHGRPRLSRVGHVGGHKNAPNLIVFPHGDWYGNLEANDLPDLVNFYVQALQTNSVPLSLLDLPNRLQWRGRMGMTRQEQRAVFSTS